MVNMHGNEKGHLNTEKRKELLDPDKIFKIIGLENGITLADIGCGTGLFSVAASRIVGENSKIYAVDVSDDMLTEVKNKAKAERINNIVAVKSEPYDFKLPDQSVDIALMSTVLHGIEEET
jgi:ubiquinone/menaquinone biosynthesis C-methylase UbiE